MGNKDGEKIDIVFHVFFHFQIFPTKRKNNGSHSNACSHCLLFQHNNFFFSEYSKKNKSSIFFFWNYIFIYITPCHKPKFSANPFFYSHSPLIFSKSTTFSLRLWPTFRFFRHKFITFKFRECKYIHIILEFKNYKVPSLNFFIYC